METKRKSRAVKEAEEVCTPKLLTRSPTVQMIIPFIPPSINELYFNNSRTRGRSLTKVGEVFKTKVKEHIATNYITELQKMNPNGMYDIVMKFYLVVDSIFTKGYPKAASPYKRKDLGNLEKALVDSIQEFVMKDDCQVFRESLVKIACEREEQQKVVVEITELFPWETMSALPKEMSDLLIYNVEHYRNKENRDE